VTFEEMEQALSRRLQACRRRLGPNSDTSSGLPDLDRVERIGEF
jgi:hypothetical protein